MLRAAHILLVLICSLLAKKQKRNQSHATLPYQEFLFLAELLMRIQIKFLIENCQVRAGAAFIYGFGKLGKKIGRKTVTTTHDREADVPHDNSVVSVCVCVFLWVCLPSAF